MSKENRAAKAQEEFLKAVENNGGSVREIPSNVVLTKELVDKIYWLGWQSGKEAGEEYAMGLDA